MYVQIIALAFSLGCIVDPTTEGYYYIVDSLPIYI